MADPRLIRNATIAVWAIAALLVVGIGAMAMNRPPAASPTVVTPNPVVTSTGGGLPVVYEFSTET